MIEFSQIVCIEVKVSTKLKITKILNITEDSEGGASIGRNLRKLFSIYYACLVL